jgi:hypothetical protein
LGVREKSCCVVEALVRAHQAAFVLCEKHWALDASQQVTEFLLRGHPVPSFAQVLDRHALDDSFGHLLVDRPAGCLGDPVADESSRVASDQLIHR